MIGGYLRRLPSGITMVILSVAIMAIGAAVASAMSGSLIVPLGGSSTLVQYNGSTWEPIGLLQNNTFFYEGNGTLLFTDTADPNNATFVAIIHVDGDYANWNDTTPGAAWRAALILVKGSATSSFGSLGSTVSEDARLVYWSSTGAYLQVIASNGNDYRGYYNIPQQLYLFRQVATTPPGYLDLGFIPGMVVVFGGLFLFIKGMRQLTASKI